MLDISIILYFLQCYIVLCTVGSETAGENAIAISN